MPPARRPSAAAVVVVVVGAAAVLAWWRSLPEPPAPAAPAAPSSAAAPPAASASPAAAAPAEPPSPIDPKDPLAAFAGRKRCAECHQDEHARWTKDWHARALNPATADYVVGKYDNAHFTGSSSEAWMSRQRDKYRMRTAGRDGHVDTFTAEWVVGGKRMQDALTTFPDGRWQILPVYYHVTGKGEWVDYTESKQGALSPDHPFYWTNFRRTANRECLDCHTTGLLVRYDRAAHTWSTQMTDAGVGCESCHGPGARHADTQDPADIIHPGKVAPEIGLALCAQCHGPRQPLFSMLDAAHRYVPGQRYEAHFEPHGLVSAGGRSGDFFVDGRPKTSSFEYQALIQSRCHLQGKATCLTCHTAPHAKAQDPDEMKPPEDGALRGAARMDASACQGCHAALVAGAGAHAHHRDPAAQRCVACHMPNVVTGVLDTFPDHAIDVPVPENTEKHGIPNACNQCHAAEPPAEMAKAIASFWPGAEKRMARRLRLADALDDRAGHPSERALRGVVGDAAEAPFLRANAAAMLASHFPKSTEEAVVPLLSAPDPLLRARAAEALSVAKPKGAADALARLREDPSLFVREAAAIALVEIGDARAEAALRALATSPATSALPRPHGLLALWLVRRGDLDGALAEAERAVDLQPYYVDALVLLADLEARRNHFDRTEALLREALSFDPQHPGAQQRLRVLLTGH